MKLYCTLVVVFVCRIVLSPPHLLLLVAGKRDAMPPVAVSPPSTSVITPPSPLPSTLHFTQDVEKIKLQPSKTLLLLPVSLVRTADKIR